MLLSRASSAVVRAANMTKRKFSVLSKVSLSTANLSIKPSSSNKSSSNKHKNNTSRSPSRKYPAVAVKPSEIVGNSISHPIDIDVNTVSDASSKKKTPWPKMYSLLGGQVFSDTVDPTQSVNPTLDHLVQSAHHNVVSVVALTHKMQIAGVCIASADSGILIDLSEYGQDDLLPSFIYELLYAPRSANLSSKPQKSKSKHVVPMPSTRYQSSLKIVPTENQTRRLRKLLQPHLRKECKNDLHPTVVYLGDRIDVLRPFLGPIVSFEKHDEAFHIPCLSHVRTPESVRALITHTQSVVQSYIKSASFHTQFHSFLASEFSRLPHFRFDLAPVLPFLGQVSIDQLSIITKPYRRFHLPPSLASSLQTLKLTNQHTVRIVYAHHEAELESAIAQLKQSCINNRVLGFDTESRPNFRANVPNHNVSLLQFASDSQVLLIRIDPKITKTLPKSVEHLLLDPLYSKVGQGLDGDVNLLCKQYRLASTARSDPLAHSFLDLAYVSAQMKFATPGLASMVAGLLGCRLSKAQQMSNWELPQLSASQIEYAALDAIVSKQIYHRMVELMQSFNQIIQQYADTHKIPRLDGWIIKPIWHNTAPPKKKALPVSQSTNQSSAPKKTASINQSSPSKKSINQSSSSKPSTPSNKSISQSMATNK